MSVYYSNSRERWRLDLRFNGHRLVTTALDRKPLERMQNIILSNQIPYATARALADDFRKGLVPPGYIGHKYFTYNLGYRIIVSYSAGEGFISRYYDTAEGAWKDPRIQQRISNAGVQLYGDYNAYLATVDGGLPWKIYEYTILHCFITVHGSIKAVKK